MRNFKKTFGAIAILGVCGLVGAKMMRMAHAATTATTRVLFHGTECQPSSFSPNGNQSMGRSMFGVHNLSATDDLIVDCPLSVPITLLKRLAPTSFEVGLYDRSTTKNVSCTLKAVFIDGSMADFATAQSSNGGPGAGFSHPGANVMTTFNGAEELAMFVECTIPPAQSGAFSHVQYYEMFYAII